jgi:hypothetical protein
MAFGTIFRITDGFEKQFAGSITDGFRNNFSGAGGYRKPEQASWRGFPERMFTLSKVIS